MPRVPPDGLPPEQEADAEEIRLAQQFTTDPAGGYRALLDRYSPAMLRMVRRFFRDQDEVMEVYTSVCERLQAQDYAALKRFTAGSAVMPWLSVVVANAARDRMRRTRPPSIPDGLRGKLSALEQVAYRYHYRQRMTEEEIAEAASYRLGTPVTPRDVQLALERIRALLGETRRWRLLDLIALRSRAVSLDTLIEMGLESGDWVGEAPPLPIERKEELRLLAEAVEAMEPEDQLLLQLRFEQDLSAPQIAEIMGYPKYSYVYTRLRTVLERMRKLLDPHRL